MPLTSASATWICSVYVRMSNDSLSPTLLAVEAISCFARAPFALEYVIPPPSQWLFPSTLAWDVQSLTARGSIGQQFAECGIPTLAVGLRVISALAAARFGYLLVITIPLWDSQIHTESKIEGTLWAFRCDFARQFDHHCRGTGLRRI